MSKEQTFACPVCNTPIVFEVQALLAGAQFICPNCQGAVSLSQESKQTVHQTMERFAELRQSVAVKSKK